MFISSKAFAYLSSFLGYRKAIEARKQTKQKFEVLKIKRNAHTDYRLVFDRDTGDWLLCFGACISLSPDDVDFPFFDECGRTGITTVTIHGNGEMKFAEEDVQLGEDDYIFSEHPKHQYPRAARKYPRSQSSADYTRAVLLEMV